MATIKKVGSWNEQADRTTKNGEHEASLGLPKGKDVAKGMVLPKLEVWQAWPAPAWSGWTRHGRQAWFVMVDHGRVGFGRRCQAS